MHRCQGYCDTICSYRIYSIVRRSLQSYFFIISCGF